MPEFKRYQRITAAEARPYEAGEVLGPEVRISNADRGVGSPKEGDMILRDPKDHNVMWLVSEDQFKHNFVASRGAKTAAKIRRPSSKKAARKLGTRRKSR